MSWAEPIKDFGFQLLELEPEEAKKVLWLLHSVGTCVRNEVPENIALAEFPLFIDLLRTLSRIPEDLGERSHNTRQALLEAWYRFERNPEARARREEHDQREDERRREFEKAVEQKEDES